ncbi:MAG: transposase, partial [Candidatus Micrarchaeia archaeon]
MVSIEEHLPSMVRVVPGSVRDVSTLKTTISDQEISKIKMVLDRGFYSEDNIEEMIKSGIRFIQPAKRNSRYYKDATEPLSNHFFYRGRLIKSIKKKVDGKMLYVYEDTKLRDEEENTLYRELDDGKISRDELESEIKKAGKILIVSNIDSEEKEIYD